MFRFPFSFKGRIRRLEYGLSYLIFIVLYISMSSMINLFEYAPIIVGLLYIILFWFRIAQSAKRCHDLGNSGFFQLIPFYGLWLLFQEGESSENRFGPNPKETNLHQTHSSNTRETQAIKPIYILIGSAVLVPLVLFLAVKYASNFEDKPLISWSERPLVWEDFELVSYMEDDYAAMIHSNIICPKLITDKDSKVYAVMDPNQSERLRGEYDGYNILTHEQYHFNITEYITRLLRKDIVAKGLGGLSFKNIKTMHSNYYKKLEVLQDEYDSITEHNADSRLQRKWEMHIDDLLRQTAYYENEDIYSYYDFTKNRTNYYKNIYVTLTNKVLTSFPIAEKDINYGKSYELTYAGPKEKIIKFYKDGFLTNGGYFETAITRILTEKKGVLEVHYLNADESYNATLKYAVRKVAIDDNKNRTVSYYDADGKRIAHNKIYETKWNYTAEDESYLSTFFDVKGRKIANKEGIFHSRRQLDAEERSIVLENFDKRMKLKNDSDFIARIEIAFNEKHKKTRYRLYDENENFAYHLNDYHLSYTYDDRGNMRSVISLDEHGEKTYDKNGASIYEYTYDLFDRETSVKRFNKDHQPIVADDDYFLKVRDYDSIGRIQFEGYYYPDYVLKYTEAMWGATKHSYEGDSITKLYNLDAYNSIIEDNTKVAIIKKRLNKKKQTVEEIYLDTLGNFAKTKDAIVIYTYKHDEKGNTIESAAHDSIGNLVAFDSDVAIVRWKFDANGNKIKTSYYTTANHLAYTADSVSHNVYTYNSLNQLIERSDYDIDMKPAALNGTFKTRFLINKMGLDSVQFDYDISGKLKKGASITKFYYNKYGTKTRTEYFNASGRRTKNTNNVSAINSILNNRQYNIGYQYLNEYDKLTNRNDGIGIEKWELDELGHTLNYSAFDKNKNAVMGSDGYHKIENQWGPMGEISRTAIYDTDLNLIEDAYGTAIYEYDLLASGLYSEVKRYNKEEKLTNNTSGIAITKYYTSINGLYYLEEELNALREVVQDSLSE